MWEVIVSLKIKEFSAWIQQKGDRLDKYTLFSKSFKWQIIIRLYVTIMIKKEKMKKVCIPSLLKY